MSDTSSAHILTPPAPVMHEHDWERIRQGRDLVEVARFLKQIPPEHHPDDARALYDTLRAETLQQMHHNPSRFKRQDVDDMLELDIFTLDEFMQQGLITPESWAKLQTCRDWLPDMTDYHKDTRLQQYSPVPATDIYFFGMPTCGKTSLLTGIAAANGQGFTLDMRTAGGPYAAALRQYAAAGLSPGRTSGKFVTTIGGIINRETHGGRTKSAPVNFVEMSGEEFALRIAETREPSMANMGTGVTNLLRNDHKKVFFIIVDASKPMVKVSFLDHEIDEDEELVRRVRSRYVSQLDILDKFAVLISLPENEDIMNNVQAIHFIVTKADALTAENPGGDRDTLATDLVYTRYLSVVEQLKNYCRRTRRINRATDYDPMVLTFSLGKFYLGDVYDYDPTDTLKIVDAAREASSGAGMTWWQRLTSMFSI